MNELATGLGLASDGRVSGHHHRTRRSKGAARNAPKWWPVLFWLLATVACALATAAAQGCASTSPLLDRVGTTAVAGGDCAKSQVEGCTAQVTNACPSPSLTAGLRAWTDWFTSCVIPEGRQCAEAGAKVCLKYAATVGVGLTSTTAYTVSAESIAGQRAEECLSGLAAIPPPPTRTEHSAQIRACFEHAFGQ